VSDILDNAQSYQRK